MMKLHRKNLVILFFCILCGCGGTTDKKLNDDFYYYQESRNNFVVLFCTSKGIFECNSGIQVIPSSIQMINYNTDYIIAKTITKEDTLFWIVDKKKIIQNSSKENSVFSYLNYSDFQIEKTKLGVNLDLKSVEEL